MLRSLPGQLRELLSSNDPARDRLFPPAHPDDERLEREYRDLVGEELEARKRSSVEVMERTIDAKRLDEEQVLAWLGAVNDLRLVLGTRLEVTEEMDYEQVMGSGPRAPAFALYQYLTYLEDAIVGALSEER